MDLPNEKEFQERIDRLVEQNKGDPDVPKEVKNVFLGCIAGCGCLMFCAAGAICLVILAWKLA